MKERIREYSTSVLQLDIRILQRHGLHVPGRTGVLRWDTTTTAVVLSLTGTVQIELNLEHASVKNEFKLTYTETRIGRRGWWSCPVCGRRCAILYLQQVFGCRQCSQLHYATQSAGPRRRALLKLKKLGALYGADPDFPCRPKWMRHRKFEQKLRQAEDALELVFPGGF